MNQTRWQQIENLYFAVLEQPENERAQFLSEKSAGDPELYEEVQSLLNSNEESADFLAKPEFELGLQLLSSPNHVLASGQNFGNYKILKFIGRGGMGEVYLAKDTRLGRQVAVKVLPSDLASDRERIRRFKQEAIAASALNHPNILTIHDIGESDGWHFIASEFIEGETLRERLKRKESPLTSEEIVEIAAQIAAALNAAHKAGIVHRDIKPENVMIREDGLVKVLDFGLAKLTENLDDNGSASNFVSTNPGMVMGTFVYMSPEQTRGQKVDARSDIWSLGVCLYEMVTGKLPFEGETTSDIIAAILTTEPALLDESSSEKPDDIWQIIGKALRKNPDDRYQSAVEMAADLKKARLESVSLPVQPGYNLNTVGDRSRIQTASKRATTSEIILPPKQNSRTFKRNKNIAGILIAVLVMAVLGSVYVAYNLSSNLQWSREPMKIARIFDTGKIVTAAISPDGKYVVHAVADAGKQSIWIKHLATNSNVQLIPPKSVDYPSMAFSKDGNYIYYGQGNGELYQTPVLGGDSKKILDGVFSPISLSPDSRQFAFIRNLSSDETALMIANSDGSGERQIAVRKKPEYFGDAAWSPDGKVIACTAASAKEAQGVYILAIPVEGGSEKIISARKWRIISQPVWLNDGSGLIASAIGESENDPQQIWFFPASGGEARQITNDLNNYGYVSLTGDSNALVTIRFEQRTNIWLLPQGKTEEAKMVSNNVHALYRVIASAPDGRIIYTSLEESSGGRNIWIMNADGSNPKQLTANAGDNILPCATSDGRYIVFSSNRGDSKTYHLWRMNMDGTNPVQLTNGSSGERGPACSRDGKTIVYTEGGPDATIVKSRLWKVSIDGGEPVQLTDYPSSWKDISPDGNYIAIRFLSEGKIKLGIITMTGGKPIKVFDLKENTQIRWKPDGRSVTYIKSDNSNNSNIWEQPIDGGEPKQLTKFSDEAIYFFDWSKDRDLICTRGYQARDPILISNFR
ncbi:MAG: serine/threonine-protein kinase [Acidobacteriota bacterium]|nr:serine/threonine-protein kinase [Acidobacteriota bacterium]